MTTELLPAKSQRKPLIQLPLRCAPPTSIPESTYTPAYKVYNALCKILALKNKEQSDNGISLIRYCNENNSEGYLSEKYLNPSDMVWFTKVTIVLLAQVFRQAFLKLADELPYCSFEMGSKKILFTDALEQADSEKPLLRQFIWCYVKSIFKIFRGTDVMILNDFITTFEDDLPICKYTYKYYGDYDTLLQEFAEDFHFLSACECCSKQNSFDEVFE